MVTGWCLWESGKAFDPPIEPSPPAPSPSMSGDPRFADQVLIAPARLRAGIRGDGSSPKLEIGPMDEKDHPAHDREAGGG